MEMETKYNNLILKEKRISGCDSILLSEPLRTFTQDLKPVDVDLTDYELVDESKDYFYYKLKKQKL
jgi:hypothetical protein